MVALPTGTVTFLFTDIQGSTRLWEEHPEAMRLALARHDALLRQAIQDNEGVVFKTIGDAFCAAFATAPEALRAALTAQQALITQVWPEPIVLLVRMALHTGAAEARDNDYFGQPLNRVARLLAAGHGGQTLLSDVASDLCADTLPPDVTLYNLGAHTLRDLGRRENLFQLQHPALPADFPPLKTLDTLPTNLPPQLTSFIGREKEIEAARSLLAKTRLLTFAGSGGSGKTRLALQVAAEVLEEFAEGVWLVELAVLTEPGLLAATIAQALRIKEQPGQTLQQTLLESLQGKSLLLVLDNCEHLLSACAHLVAALLRSCPLVKVLTTSREALGIAGEQTYRVPSLTAPDLKQKATPESLSQYEAVRLFLDRACFHKPQFAVTNANAPALAAVCYRLDGIPLAIELAAARVRSLPVEEINTRLDNRFRLLTGGDRAALPRQQTLRALIDWSYDLLSVQEKVLLGRLCVFMGGWTLAGAEQVCGGESASGAEIEAWEVFDLLSSLVDKSLVLAEEQGSAARYRLLETVRQYGRDRLLESGESEPVRSKHRDYFLVLAEEAEPQLIGPEQGEWLKRLEAEHENLRAGLDWSLSEEKATECLRFCGALSRYWETRGYLAEGREWCVRSLDKSGGEERSAARAKALNSAGTLATAQSDYPSARASSEESLTIWREIGDRRGIAASLNNLGSVANNQGNYAPARAFYEESLTIQREIGNRSGIAASLGNLGSVANNQGNYASARAFFEESLAIRREIGDRSGIATSLGNLGIVANNQGDYASARAFFEESLAIRREIGNRSGIADSLTGLGTVANDESDYASARAFYEESLTIRREIGNRSGIADSLTCLGTVADDQGDYASARAFFEESLTIQREIGNRSGIALLLYNLGIVADHQGDYASARAYFEESLQVCREIDDLRGIAASLTGLGMVAYSQGNYTSARTSYKESLTIYREIGNRSCIANSLSNLGTVADDQGDYASARAYFEESLQVCREIGDLRGIAVSLEGFAFLANRESRSEQAAGLWGAAEALRVQIGAPLAPTARDAYEREVAQARQVLGEEALSAAWAAGMAMTLEEATDYALQSP